ncbi:Putative voltage-gated potassium channel subunit [Sparassis crispa]|uniref:Voltage-gated potassium channel subunit n=1 Tax=Sparassis crispa TaxID=139825 RepID=A0A401G522_9APHY|nr:Putative voltage-gated potassium channel subunit [Sparassis crispa]GBE77268.1 Putative voltage-gated potassium channel subunit [Sparassis crispa]
MSVVKMEYEDKGMPFRRLGNSGLRVPVFSFGGWLTLGEDVIGDPVKDIMKVAFENGVNMFDTAEGYGAGNSEVEMGRVIKELGLRRTDLIITTKIFFGTRKNSPNDTGLSRKHIIEGAKLSLQRLQLDYVDVLFAHRPDPSVPMEEVVRAFNFVIDQGWAFYWATSEWSAFQVEEAMHVADKLGLVAPIADQAEKHMFHRERVDKEYLPLFEKYQYGTTIWSALAGGMLTGKYNNGVPSDSRFAKHGEFYGWFLNQPEEAQRRITKVKALTELAEKELGCTMTQLALAWVAVSPNTSTVILGATKPAQVLENLKAIQVIPKLTPAVLDRIEAILESKPAEEPLWGRPVLDKFGRQTQY